MKIANSVGVRKVVRRARRFGIRSPLRANLSITLGSSGVTLLELTSLYATLANRGRRIEPHVISFVMDSDGKSIWNATSAVTQSVPPEEAYVMLNLLENVVQSGTAVRARELKRPLAGKTGTTNDYHDAWLIGVSPQYSAGVWVGMDDKATIGRNETGGRAALPIWMKIMGAIHEGLPRLRFRRPAKVRFVSIDPHTGLRVPRGSEGSVRQAFVRGTEPSGNFPLQGNGKNRCRVSSGKTPPAGRRRATIPTSTLRSSGTSPPRFSPLEVRARVRKGPPGPPSTRFDRASSNYPY